MINSFVSKSEGGVSRYMHAIRKEHRMSIQDFIDTVIFHSSTNGTELTLQNFTLTGQGVLRFKVSSDFHYSLPPTVLPFTGWDYKAIKKTGCYAASLPKMYTIYLSQILQKCLEKLSSERVKFHFIWCDVLNIEASLPTDLRYDRITTCNLWDYCPLTILLTKFKGFLNESNPHAVMLTETICWSENFVPEIIHVLPYVSGVDDLCNRALKDTGNHELAHLSGNHAVVENLNLTSQFLKHVSTCIVASFLHRQRAPFVQKEEENPVCEIAGIFTGTSSPGLH